MPLQWQVTYEAVDAAGNFADAKVRTVEIQVGREIGSGLRFIDSPIDLRVCCNLRPYVRGRSVGR